MKKTIDQIDVRGKRVLVRLDLDVPIDDHGRIADDRRIRAALPTVKRLQEQGGRLVLLGHRGRPKSDGSDRSKLTLAPVATRLSELLGKPVRFVSESVGEEVRSAVTSLRDGDVLLLENLRFHEAETIKDKKAGDDPKLRETKAAFAKQLADLGDTYVNDAFGTCHRDNASMVAVPKLMAGKPRVAGYHLQKELRFLGNAIANPARPFVCLLGGAKVSDKLGVIRSLLDRCDTILIGGAMAYTFLAAEGGLNVGKSLVEPELFETARTLRRDAGNRLRLPVDSVTATKIAEGVRTTVCDGSIPADQMGLDIGPRTIAGYRDVIATAKTIVWNGPMGVFETPPFDQGTLAMAKALADATARGATTIIGGGDSAAAVDKMGLAERMTHISTGGGASLEFLEGKQFPALNALEDE